MTNAPTKQRQRRFAHFFLAAVGAVAWSGCGGEPQPITSQTSKYEVADDAAAPSNSGNAPASEQPGNPEAGDPSKSNPSARADFASSDDQTGAPPKPSSQPPAAVEVPPTAADGPQKLLQHISKLEGKDPRGATREESLNNLVKNQNEIVDTANLVLTSKADEPTQLRAAEAKVQALSLLSQIPQNQKQAQADLKTFVGELNASPHAKLKRLASRMDFAQQMDAFSNGQSKDIGQIVEQFKKLFAEEEKDESLFRLSQQITQIFLQSRHSKEAGEIMKMVAEAFSGSSNENLAKAAGMIREQIPIVELQIEEKFGAILEDKPKAKEELLAAMDKVFSAPEKGEITLQMFSQMAQMLEGHDIELADKMYAKLGNAFAKHPTAQVAKAAQDALESFKKRKAIIGQPFEVEGVLLDGKPFDWGKYQGKVVLIDFWATWCQPCLAEIPNIQQNYDLYHDQGFEVVGINLDDDPAAVQQFFARQRLPWATVLSPDPEKVGFQHPLAVKCGVEAIPFLVLVGRDGKAIGLNLRGEALGKKLATMFTEPSEPGAANPLRKEKAADKKAAETKAEDEKSAEKK